MWLVAFAITARATRRALARGGAPPDAADPPLLHSRAASVIVINPSKGNVALAERRDWFPRSRSNTPSSLEKAPTAEGSPSCHVIPFPPPSPRPPSPLPPLEHHCVDIILRLVSSHTLQRWTRRRRLLLVRWWLGGTQSAVTPSQVVQLLGQHYSVDASDVQVKRYSRADFLLVFSSRQLADQVLHTPPPPRVAFHLVFQRRRRQAGALFKPFWFMVLLAVSNIPAHVWSIDVMQGILGSSCLIFDTSPRSLSDEDMSCFLVAAWCSDHPFIPTEVGFSVPELVAPFREGELPLFLHASEIIHSSCDLLHYWTIINVLEYHDFTTPPSSDDGSADGFGGGSDDEEYPGYSPGWGFESHLMSPRGGE
jgi:hypothetical protein